MLKGVYKYLNVLAQVGVAVPPIQAVGAELVRSHHWVDVALRPILFHVKVAVLHKVIQKLRLYNKFVEPANLLLPSLPFDPRVFC